ncbi:carbohydrate ABC transporter substrate-binding protein [Candidatus Gracilibacteria bacterium]|nr:carbohydrate ABC transporter substrate-binding protein [Candidatus Gracilibacteria bacterium]
MEYNKNKLIFAVVGVIIVLSIVFLLKTMSSTDKTSSNSGDKNKVFKIWVVGDLVNDSSAIIDGFKKVYPNYKNREILLESFNSYEDYTYTLMSALNSGLGPDIFVLNNNDKGSVFSNQVLGIDPNIVNPNDFRKKYKLFFSDDLIGTFTYDGETKEYLVGLPVGYETLGVFYNRRYLKEADISNLSTLNNVISDLKTKYPDIIPFGIGNGSTVDNSSDIMTQFFMMEGGVTGLGNVNSKVLGESVGAYLLYGDIDGYNGYNLKYQELKDTRKTSLNLFSLGEVMMVAGYPSTIKKIKENGFSKSLLQAGPFPTYYSGAGKMLVNYNYFAINKETTNLDLANSFISYLYSDNGALNFLDSFPYYLPALLSLESDKLGDKIDSDYSITLGDFYSEKNDYSSFDKGVKTLYDKSITILLDKDFYDSESFNAFKESVMCKANKITTFTNLSVNCDR